MGQSKQNAVYNRKHDLSVQEIQQLDSFKHYTDEQAEALAEAIKKFTVIVFGCFQAKNRNVPLVNIDPINKAA